MPNKRSFGIRVMGERTSVDKPRKVRLDTDEKLLKYNEVVDIVVRFPALAQGTSWSKTVEYYFKEDKSPLSYIPMYDYRVKGYNGYWGKPYFPGFQSTYQSRQIYPYLRDQQSVSRTKFKLQLKVNNGHTPPFTIGYDYPAHDIVIRLFLLHDQLETT